MCLATDDAAGQLCLARNRTNDRSGADPAPATNGDDDLDHVAIVDRGARLRVRRNVKRLITPRVAHRGCGEIDGVDALFFLHGLDHVLELAELLAFELHAQLVLETLAATLHDPDAFAEDLRRTMILVQRCDVVLAVACLVVAGLRAAGSRFALPATAAVSPLLLFVLPLGTAASIWWMIRVRGTEATARASAA